MAGDFAMFCMARSSATRRPRPSYRSTYSTTSGRSPARSAAASWNSDARKKIERGSPPPEPNLLVLEHSCHVGIGPCDAIGKSPEDAIGIDRLDRDVDIDVCRRPRFERVVGQRERPAECMSHSGRGE